MSNACPEPSNTPTSSSLAEPVSDTPTTPGKAMSADAMQHAIDLARLLNLAEACKQGQWVGVTMELTDWCKQPNCPTAAMVLHAAMLARSEQTIEACRVLEQAIGLGFEPDHVGPSPAPDGPAMRLALAVLLDAGLEEDARQLALGVQARLGQAHPLLGWMALMAIPGMDQTADETSVWAKQDPRHLGMGEWAAALSDNPSIVPSLVAACVVKPEPHVVLPLRQALAQIVDLPHLSDVQSQLCLALAELAWAQDDAANAKRWAKRGLRLAPLHANLAMVYHQAASAHAMDADQATDVLARVHSQHPDYPDVAAALIRREHAQGHTDQANHRLADWLQKAPTHPTAHQLKRELAA